MHTFANTTIVDSAPPHRAGDETATSALEFVFVERPRYQRMRRIVDVVAASLFILVTLPLLAAAAVAIVLEDGGPIVFRQRRVGRFERLFTMYKLRTMRANECGDALSPAAPGDARITRVGAVLRKLSIDELPQLWNVVRGEMTLVGPRPEMPFVVDRYEPWQHLRHFVVPGLTGLWQVSCRSRVPLHSPEATLLDLLYIRTASTVTDLSILAKTVRAVIETQGAY